jgi:[ribosomal protein S18]-alanine N-acetyltransferase
MIREMASADAPGVECVLAVSAGASQWSAGQILLLANGGTRIWVAEESGEVIGASAVRAVADEVEVLTLGVAPSWRRRGVGGGLMSTALAEAAKTGARQVFLEVRESNQGARAFYAALGFVESGRRRAYYRDPSEDALILSRPVPAR